MRVPHIAGLMSRVGILFVTAVFLSGCATVSPSLSSVPSPADSAPADGAACVPVDLRDAAGQRLDLTGTWEGGPFVHHVRQINDCVWWIGYARWPGLEPGELATLAFFGRLSGDFTLTGRWATIVRPDASGAYFPGPTDAEVTFDIEFDPGGGPPRLVPRGAIGVSEEAPLSYPAATLHRLGPLPESANPPQQ
jgi:hypothetical protein